MLARPELLARALANLVRDAARYAGGTGRPAIAITAERQRDQLVVSVADRGPGVPADAVGRLFDPFFRLEADRARDTGGSGLGLAIVKACVEACLGTVSARNLSPSGFEVRMTLRAAGGS